MQIFIKFAVDTLIKFAGEIGMKILEKIPKIHATLVTYRNEKEMIRLVNSEPITLHSIKVKIGKIDEKKSCHIKNFLIKGRHTGRLYQWISRNEETFGLGPDTKVKEAWKKWNIDREFSGVFLRPNRSIFIDVEEIPDTYKKRLLKDRAITISCVKDLLDQVYPFTVEYRLTETKEIDPSKYPQLYKNESN